jgi:hypothetical protein
MAGVQVVTTNYTIALNQNNDEVVQLTITEADPGDSGTLFNLTGLEVEFFIKTSKNTPDSDPATVKLTTVGGQVVLTNPTKGIATVTIAAANIATAGALWWRCDVVNMGDAAPRKTAGCGNLNIQPV